MGRPGRDVMRIERARAVSMRLWPLICAAVALFASGTQAGCPTTSHVGGLDGTAYTCTTVDDSNDCITVGQLIPLTSTFATPERTGVVLAGGGLGFTVKCAKVEGYGATIETGSLAAKVIGCYGTPDFGNGPTGLGAIVVKETSHADCAKARCPCDVANGVLQSASANHPDQYTTTDAEDITTTHSCGTCTCEQYTCAWEKPASDNGKVVRISGGNEIQGQDIEFAAGTCKIGQAECDDGFLDGEIYTAYTETVGITLKDSKNDPYDWSHKLGDKGDQKSNGVYTYPTIKVNDFAIHTKELTITYTASGTASGTTIKATHEGTFKVYPTSFKLIQAAAGYPGTVAGSNQYTSSCEYTVGNENADLGMYAIQLLDSAGEVISDIDIATTEDKNFFSAEIKLITGKNDASPKHDSSKVPTAQSMVTLDKDDLLVTLKGNDMSSESADNTDTEAEDVTSDIVKMNANVGGKHSMRFHLKVANQVGNSYKIFIQAAQAFVSTEVGAAKSIDKIYGCSGQEASFRIHAGAILAAFGEDKTAFDADKHPRIVRADSTNSNSNYGTTLNVAGENGLPSKLHVLFKNTGGNILESANCYQCVQARLLMCADRLSAKSAYPRCSSVSQAVCVTSNSDGSKCASSGVSGTSFLDTLGGTTVVNMVDGVATFENLKIHYVFGAGYRLQFMLNAGLNLDGSGNSFSQAYAPSTQFTSAGTIQVPDPSYSTVLDPKNYLAGVSNSFFVRPYSLEVYQQVGGDGVDLNNDNVPDGAGVGMVFRVQPAVVVKGDGYDFNKGWDTHGWAPVTAILKEKSCMVAEVFEDKADTANIAEGGGVDNQDTSTTVKLATAISSLDVGEYIKTAANEYMKVTEMADSGKTLTVERAASPPGLTQGSIAAAAAGSAVTIAELVGNCLQRGTNLYGRITKPVWYASKFTASQNQASLGSHFSEKSYFVSTSGNCVFPLKTLSECLAANKYLAAANVDPDGTVNDDNRNSAEWPPYCFISGGKLEWNSATDGPTTYTHTHSDNPTSTICRLHGESPTDEDERDTVQMSYTESNMLGGRAGMLWKDLRVDTLVAFEDKADTANIAEGGGVDNQDTSTTVKLDTAISSLDVGEYIKTAANEYMKVTEMADSGKTLTVERAASPPGLTQGSIAAAAAGSAVTIAESGTILWQGDIVLEFRVGPASADTDTYTSVFGNKFDVFVAPDPPTNLRVTSYDHLGFRVEFQPSVVSRAQPLSGFIIEVGICNNATNSEASCTTKTHPAFTDDPRYTITSALGTDLSAGGGMTLDVLVNFTNPTPGETSAMDLSFTPQMTLHVKDQIVLNLGRTFRMLGNFDTSCTLQGPNKDQLAIAEFDKDNMAFLLNVTTGVLHATKPVYATLPTGCGIKIPGSTVDEVERSRFGTFVRPLPSILHAPVLGDPSSRRFDNCKGTSGCSVTASYLLSTVQDASSMDTSWSGQLRFGGTGVQCAATPLPAVSTAFPSNRLCSTYSIESRCKDLGGVLGSDGVCCSASCGTCGGSGCGKRPGGSSKCCGSSITTQCVAGGSAPCRLKSTFYADASLSDMQHSGDNGKPIGSNPGVGASTGSLFSDSDAECRSGRGAKNPCALSVGNDWTLGVNTSYSWGPFKDSSAKTADIAEGGGVDDQDTSTTVKLATAITDLRVNDYIKTAANEYMKVTEMADSGKTLTVERAASPPGLTQGSIAAAAAGSAVTLAEPKSDYPLIGASFIRDRALAFGDIIEISLPGLTRRNSGALTTEVYLNHTDKAWGWESSWNAGENLMSVKVGTSVSPGMKVEIFVYGFVSSTIYQASEATEDCALGSVACDSAMETIANVKRGQKTTILFKNLATKSSHSTRWGDPVAAYTQTTNAADGIPIHSAAIYSFRVYAYNGRYKSGPAITSVHNRAIERPSKPLYFPQISQESMLVNLLFTNLAGPQAATTSLAQVSSPTPGQAGLATRIGVKFTPKRVINEKETLDLHLPKFTGPSFLSINNQAANLLLAHAFQPSKAADGGDDNCACDTEGRILTPAGDGYSCSCSQNLPNPFFTDASWSQFTETLVLTVGPKKMLPANKETTVWISINAGLKLPDDGSLPKLEDGTIGLEAFFMRFQLNWISQFPRPWTPRLGFVIQFTSDLFWKTNIQTVVVPDNLDQGVVSKETVAILAAPTSLDGEDIKLSSPARFLNGRYIQIEDEIMKVLYANSSSEWLTVRRGQFSSPIAVHPIASGGDGCSCGADGSSVGGGACQCNGVQVLVMGATDQSVGGGLDFKIGPAASGCRFLSDAGATKDEGCNIRAKSSPQEYTFPFNIRMHQSAMISGEVTPSLNFVSACGGTAATCTSGKCNCDTAGLLLGAEFSNQRPRGNVSLVSPGNVMDFPVDFKTRLLIPAAGTTDNSILIVLNPIGLIGNYVRIGDEIMKVTDQSRGIWSVLPFKAQGVAAIGNQCSCTVDGTASGGGTCSCSGNQGTGCTAGGILEAIGGGGKEFLATFTVANGKVSGITVVSPGFEFQAEPKILISSGGDGCSGVQFHVRMTTNTVRVKRAQLGTSVGAHAVNAIVNTVLWPSQKKPNQPGRQYNFRIASYNAAGFSDFAYYEIMLYDAQPKILSAAGGTSIEIHLWGGGINAKGYTVYIGRLSSDGSVDLTKSKKCEALVNLDLAGTRMTCKAPAWVGGQFDLIVHYKSGSVEHIATGNSWMKYMPPEITSVTPPLVDSVPKVPVVFTVRGKNFGLSSHDVVGMLDGKTPLPCMPLEVKSDSEVLCTLTPISNEDVLEGDIVIQAGNTSFHGKPQFTKKVDTSKIAAKPANVTAKATIEGDATEILASPQKREEFENQFKIDIVKAARVLDPSFSAAQISIDGLESGSIIVVFTIAPSTTAVSASSPAAVAMDLAQQAADPTSVLRQGSLTSSVKVALPAGIEDQADVGSSSASGAVPLYFSSCEPKTYTSNLDMKRCYTCCTYLCQTGNEAPQVQGADVLPAFRAQACQRLCLGHCGYDRERAI